jgi:hydroxymethylglutaryl-CoA synthase
MRVGRGWKDAASRINFAAALENPSDLTEAQYLALHEGRTSEVEAVPVHGEFVVDHVGREDSADFQDLGIEYYRFVD